MRLRFFFVFSFITSVCSSQVSVYHPFPDSNAVWNVHVQACCATACTMAPPVSNPSLRDDYFNYFFDGDTTINSIPYRKIYKTGSQHFHCVWDGNPLNPDNWYSYSHEYAGALREDSTQKKVYCVLLNDNSESLLYDFSANVGDTLNTINCGLVIQSIDSFMANGSYRKKFNLTGQPSYSIIEGIGSTAGLFEELCPFETYGWLQCFTENNILLYHDTLLSCDIPTGINAVPLPTNPSLFPNPFSDHVTLFPNENLQGCTIRIIDLMGNLIRIIKPIDSSPFIIERNNLASGLYFLHIDFPNKKPRVLKLIIEDK
jgi:hypothetical protein